MKARGRNINLTNVILWVVYLALLLVLLPHTAWLFARFEAGAEISPTAWAAAFAFEAAIAVLTHKLAKHIEETPNHKNAWKRFTVRYLNAFSVGLIMAVGVSALANLAHAVEFGQPLKIFAEWGIEPKFYQLAFGAVLPIVSLLFARVLSNVSESEPQANDESETVRRLRKRLRETEQQFQASEQRASQAEQSLSEFAGLRSGSKADRILAAHQIWPDLPQRSVAVVASSSLSHVSEVLANSNGRGVSK